jgi:hypothetical protein
VQQAETGVHQRSFAAGRQFPIFFVSEPVLLVKLTAEDGALKWIKQQDSPTSSQNWPMAVVVTTE